MELNKLYQNINNHLYTMMLTEDSNNLQQVSNKIIKLLEEEKELLRGKAEVNHVIYILTAIVSAFFAYIVLQELFPKISIVLIICSIIFSIFITLIIISSTKYHIDSAILLISTVSKKGWTFSTLNSVEIWEEWSDLYPFLTKGDMDDKIALRINGSYENFSFCYFEYDYTIEEEEEVEYEDSDGNMDYETEYYYEDYTESCIIINLQNTLPYIEIRAGSVQSNAMKFSYIDLNKKVSVYSSDINKATSFFTPSTQQILTNFYTIFPYSNISIKNNFIFINFGIDLNNIPRSIGLDERLLLHIKNNKTVATIDATMLQLLPILNAAN